MRTIKLTASDGETLTGHLPESWAEVPLGPYLDFQATAQPLPACIKATAHPFAHPAGCQALATLLGLPTAEPLLANVQLLLPLYEAAPWLFDGPHAPAPPPPVSFTHLGIAYRYACAAELGPAVAASRERVLLWYLRETDGNPAHCITQLLATLYTPGGTPLTAAQAQAGNLAFETLPLSVAWPCLLQFFGPSSLASPVDRYLALRPMVAQALAALEAAVVAAPAPAAATAPNGWLARAGRAWHRATTKPLVLS